MFKSIVLAVAVAAVASTASAGEILVIHKKQGVRFPGPFSAQPVPVVEYDYVYSHCGCCGCAYDPYPPKVRFETSVHRSGIGADSTIRANSDSDDSRVRYMYIQR